MRHNLLVAAMLAAGALAVAAVVAVLVRTGDETALGALAAILPGVLVAAFSGSRRNGRCHGLRAPRRER